MIKVEAQQDRLGVKSRKNGRVSAVSELPVPVFTRKFWIGERPAPSSAGPRQSGRGDSPVKASGRSAHRCIRLCCVGLLSSSSCLDSVAVAACRPPSIR